MIRALVLVTGDPSGDVLFAVTTGEDANERIDARDLGVVGTQRRSLDAACMSWSRRLPAISSPRVNQQYRCRHGTASIVGALLLTPPPIYICDQPG